MNGELGTLDEAAARRRSPQNGFQWSYVWRHDFLSSIVVFLVALPLCMGIAIASGVPVEKAAAVGIITGIIGGLIVGPISGCPLQVSGPAAGLSVIIFELIRSHGWERLGWIILFAGALQFTAGVLKLGQWFRAVSPAVIYGMLAGIGVLIFASQFHVMVDDVPKGNGIANLLSIPQAVWLGLTASDEASHVSAARIGLLTIVALVVWKLIPVKTLKVVPAPLVAVVVATAAALALDLVLKRVELPANLLDAVHLPAVDWITEATALDTLKSMIVAGASLAFIASAETLLSATAVDQMHQGPRARYDRELLAQGIGNSLCGVLGVLPMTGVIVRSSANVEAGARTRASAILHGVWLLLFVAMFPFVLKWIPTSSLAAILVYTGYKLVDFKVIKKLWAYSRSEVLIYVLTVCFIVGTDLLTGVVVGIIASALKLLYTFSHLGIRFEDDSTNGRTVMYLEGTATFIRLPKLASALERVPPNSELHVHFEHLDYIDHACLDLLMTWEKQHETTGGSLVIDWEILTARFRQYRKLNGNSKG